MASARDCFSPQKAHFWYVNYVRYRTSSLLEMYSLQLVVVEAQFL